MALQKSPHTQSQQNTHFAQTDQDESIPEQRLGTGADAAIYENRDGAQTGGERSPRHTPGSARPHNVEPESAAWEGSLRSRVFDDADKQGISSRSSRAERPGQEKVVKARPDSRAGVNHSSKKAS
jgi:hypothetical protein